MQNKSRIYGKNYQYPRWLSLWRWWLVMIAFYAIIKIIATYSNVIAWSKLLGLIGLFTPAGNLLPYSFSQFPLLFLDAAFVLFVGIYFHRWISRKKDLSLKQRFLFNIAMLLFLSWFIDLGIFGHWTSLSALLH
jgi:hypothetical protein